MCDGYRDETQWTLHSRTTGQPVLTSSGHTFVFSEEADAQAFLQDRPDAAALEIVPIPSPELSSSS
jgi:hypothetical protein